MYIDGDRLVVPIDTKIEDIDELLDFILPRLEYIEVIDFESQTSFFETSSFIAFLVSIKKTKPSIKISIFDLKEYDSKEFGKMNWICNG
jgi:hypothetical protein